MENHFFVCENRRKLAILLKSLTISIDQDHKVTIDWLLLMIDGLFNYLLIFIYMLTSNIIYYD